MITVYEAIEPPPLITEQEEEAAPQEAIKEPDVVEPIIEDAVTESRTIPESRSDTSASWTSAQIHEAGGLIVARIEALCTHPYFSRDRRRAPG